MIYSASFFLMTLAVTCAAPFSSRDEVTRHLLSVMQDKISATYQSTALNQDLLFKVIQELSSKRVDQPLKVSSFLSRISKARLQRKKFQDLASKFLGQVMMYELQPSILKQQKLCTGKQCMTTKKIAAKLGSTVQGRVQGHKNHLAKYTEAEIPEDRIRTIIFKDCLGALSKTFAETLKLHRDFGSQDSKIELLYQFMHALSESYFKYAESNDVLEAIKTFVTSYVRLIIDSEDLVGNVQVIPDWRSLIDFLKKTGRNLIQPTGKIFSNLIKDKDSREVFQHVVDLASVLLNDEDSSALNPSISFFSQLVDGTKLSDEVKNSFKKTIKNTLLILFKMLRGKDTSKEDKLTFFDSFLRLLFSRYNFGTETTNALVSLFLNQYDYFFTHGDVKRELSPELLSLIFQLRQSVSKELINATDNYPFKYEGFDRCVNRVLDAINTNFTDFPAVPIGRAASDDSNNEIKFSPREFALKEKFSVPLWYDLKYRKN